MKNDKINQNNSLLVFEPGTLVTVTLNGFCDVDDWLPKADGPLAGVTDTEGGICVFFDDGDESNGSLNVFCSFAADKPNTISSSFLFRFSFPLDKGGSSFGVGCMKKKIG